MPSPSLTVVGGGPAGLMAAEVACAAGIAVDLYEGKGSVGRKFLIAGKGGLNLTHSDDFARFVERYGSRREKVEQWLTAFDADDLREWARGLGVETFVGTSGRVFPTDLKAAPLLRGWVRRLRQQGVRFHMHHYCQEMGRDGRTLRFLTPDGERIVHANAVVLAMGGGSWPELGSDGQWVPWLREVGAEVATLQPSNCGFEVGWSEVFAQRYAGQPVKSVLVSTRDGQGNVRQLQGEFVITATGVEGSAIYALSADLRDAIAADGVATLELDMAPGRDRERLQRELSQPRGSRTLTEHLRRTVGIDGVKAGLLYEVVQRSDMTDPGRLAAAIKALTLRLVRARPIAEAISSAGGVSFAALDDRLMIRALPGVFCAGEMIDWEAPTGGYLLTACFASGRVAGQGAAAWLRDRALA
ncbi:MAG TPA: TIGR03862 family flavoprotein [Steroidobacteraceae bacterium]